MNVSDLTSLLRTDILDDTESDNYLWSTATLLKAFDWAEEQACIRANILDDEDTASDDDGNALCQIALKDGTGVYTVSGKVLRVFPAYTSSNATKVILPKSLEWLNEFYYAWRTAEGEPSYMIFSRQAGRTGKIRFVPEPNNDDTAYLKVSRLPLRSLTIATVTGSADISFAASTKKISTAGAGVSFLDLGFKAWHELVVAGTSNNDGTYTVVAVAAQEITVEEALVDENNTSAVLTGSSIPEIPDEYHLSLLDGAAEIAYGKHDSQTYDAGKRHDHAKRFVTAFGLPVSAKLLERRRRPRKKAAYFREYGT